jgi:tRNA(fMet)-specific endonuclease VapC
MKLSVDSDVAIEIIHGKHPHYRVWLEAARSDGAALHLSSIVFHELMLGAMVSARPEHQMQRVEWLASQMDVHSWTPDDAIEAARIRADLRLAGAEIGSMDTLIAGQAVNGGWTLVTGNVKEFIRIRHLAILSWADPDGPKDRASLIGRFPTK